MSIQTVTPAEIAAMKARLAERQAARRLDLDCMQAVQIVADKRQRESAQQPQQTKPESPKSDWGTNAFAAATVAASAWSAWRRGKLDENLAAKERIDYDFKRSIRLARVYRGIKK